VGACINARLGEVCHDERELWVHGGVADERTLGQRVHCQQITLPHTHLHAWRVSETGDKDTNSNALVKFVTQSPIHHTSCVQTGTGTSMYMAAEVECAGQLVAVGVERAWRAAQLRHAIVFENIVKMMGIVERDGALERKLV
jgi:hypothetical protein